MLGTGLSASSLSESTIPSTTSSSSTEGMYCRHIGSSGDLMRSTMAGEMRNSKLSAASRKRSRSGKFSGPNLRASASSDAIEFFLRTSCHVSAMIPPSSCELPLYRPTVSPSRTQPDRRPGHRNPGLSLLRDSPGPRKTGGSPNSQGDLPSPLLSAAPHQRASTPSPEPTRSRCRSPEAQDQRPSSRDRTYRACRESAPSKSNPPD